LSKIVYPERPVFYRFEILNPNWSSWIIEMKLKGEGFNVLYISRVAGWIYLAFEESLTLDEEERLSKLMSDVNIGLYPKTMKGFTVFEIHDLYDAWEKLEKETGLKIKWIFCNIPRHEFLEVWFEGILSENEKRKFLKAYSKLIREKTK